MRIRHVSGKLRDRIALWLLIERRASAKSRPYVQKIYYETENVKATVATALTEINSREMKDERGEIVAPIRWECSCLQKKCGACAMVINGTPRLACDSFLRDYQKQIRIGPLRKFPVIADLMVDRSILFSNLKTMETWLDAPAQIEDKDVELTFDASRCLQCGCCLEVCPNFCPEGSFFGAAGFVPTAGVLASLPAEACQDIRKNYLAHAYAGCGKSLACHKICPAGIDIEHLLIHSNKIVF